MSEEIDTLCDGCGDAIPLDEANQIEFGENAGAMACNECYINMESDPPPEESHQEKEETK